MIPNPENAFNRNSRRALGLLEYVGLIIITVATVVAGWQEVRHMLHAGRVGLADLLLLFLYLEVLTMVGQYFGTGKLPIRTPIYIAIVALARYLILDVKDMSDLRVIIVAGAILLLTVGVLALRFGHVRLPYPEDDCTGALMPGHRPRRRNTRN